MGVISNITRTLDKTLVDYAQVVFQGVAEPIRELLGAMALVSLLFIAINHIIQFRTINYSVYLHWALRYILIYSFATMWVNFEGIYSMLIDVPNNYASIMMHAAKVPIKNVDPALLDPKRISDTSSAMDEFAHAVLHLSGRYITDFSIWHVGKSFRNVFIGVLFIIVGGFFIAACAFIVMMAKIGFAVSISLAPLAIIMLMMPQTSQYFESWTRFTVGFVVLPLLTATLMAIVLYVAADVYVASRGNDFAFIFIIMAATALLFMIPTMASSLASVSVAAVGAGAASGAASAAAHMAWGAAKKVHGGSQRSRDGVSVASAAREAGAEPAAAAWSAVSAMRQSAHIRQQRRDERLARCMSGLSSSKSNATRDPQMAVPIHPLAQYGNRTVSPEQDR
ncbi:MULTISPECIES: type IV secretion system protein [unclassified Mesorhizobium]|uniref:type IV secretion system protein n=1 Tax=unclassified Mesorhizobium TaxID=325217 RepID=UPI000FE439E4|nr:type IV secretion system protein [Mesorhizobium sp.]RWN48745.1 MAG: type IV secretion system protein [Mesorhizobium sp.]RWN57677.1 MAG: type IV secretion system protein [Mesorhizobium sp.]RWN68460.1 MAG: type IV secretion system protein [Mesorhizobium sp.]RWN69020.1 MAG: type IV secretion system protein [Mesorhizobium sp.]RWN79956.1 MAG: type IV secretion system protein [Mesorhizobium sp.]